MTRSQSPRMAPIPQHMKQKAAMKPAGPGCVRDMDGKPKVIKAADLSGKDNILFRRNSVTGAVEAVPWKGDGIELNAALHSN